MNVAAEKSEMRLQAKALRATLARRVPDLAGIIATWADQLPVETGSIVSGYRTHSDEADPSRLISALRARGCEICYPRVHMKAHPLWFHVPVADEPWMTGAFGIEEPRPGWPRAFPSFLLIPLLAFDAKGGRLGYGDGYYDRTLMQFRAKGAATAIGIAFASQEVQHVPNEAGDEKLDMVVTEAGLRRFLKR